MTGRATAPGMHNVVMAPARVGFVAGSPLAAKAYLTPEHPEGIVQRDLGQALPNTQRRTAMLWFVANLEPFPRPGTPYFGFAEAIEAGQPQPFTLGASQLDGGDQLGGAPMIAGLDQGSFAPPHFDALNFLTAEFGQIIPPTVLEDVAAALPGQWSFIQPQLRPDGQPSEDTTTNPLLQAIDDLKLLLEAQQTVHGGYGHNSGGAPFDSDTLRLIIESTLATRDAVAEQRPVEQVQQAIAPAAAARPRIMHWLASFGAGALVEKAAEGAATKAGRRCLSGPRKQCLG
jgi:hypothetical protein